MLSSSKMHHQTRCEQRVFPSLKCSSISLAILNGKTMSFAFCNIYRRVSFLLALDVLRRCAITRDFGSGYMRAKGVKWHIKCHYIGEHAYISLNSLRVVLYSKAEREKLHVQFFQPSSGKLRTPLRRVRPYYTPSAIRDILKLFPASCSHFQEIHAPPFRCRISVSEDAIRFNAKVAKHFVGLEKRPVPHTIYGPASDQ